MAKLAKALSAAAGNAGGDKVYVEDVFSNYLYTTDDSARTITNGIDLAGEGGLVWFKSRNTTQSHALFDSTRGNNVVYSNKSNAQDPLTITGGSAGSITLNNNGFSFNGGLYSGQSNINSGTTTNMVSYTFRKQTGFFDVKSVAGPSGSDVNVDFSDLGSIGLVMMKEYSGSGNWAVWCKGMNADYHLKLNSTEAVQPYNYTTVSGTTVTLKNGAWGGNTTIIYAFADGDDSSAQIFGEDGDEAIIKTGSYTGSGAVGKTITLGFEPQWMLIKNADNTTPWVMIDNMRGMPVNGEGVRVLADQSAAEVSSASYFAPRADGVEVTLQNTYVNTSGETYIYMAIRRGPMKEPSAGTDVLGMNGSLGSSDNAQLTTGNLVDVGWQYLNGDGAKFFTRLLGEGYLNPTSTAAANTSAATEFDYMDGFAPYYAGSIGGFNPRQVYGFRRYPKVFDVVCYAGAGGNADVTHNLGVAPEMMIVKARDKSEGWAVQAYPALSLVSRVGFLNATSPFSGNSQFNGAPTATVFKVGNSGNTNESGYNYVAYLFATLAGISKVGSYTGTGNTLNVDCGFSGGARFVMIKRADAGAGPDNWFVFDSVRGISVGNDPWFAVNTTAAQVTTNDYISTYASGFTVSATTASGINENYGDYIFLAFA
jgi:hypothetical protein